MSVRSNHSTAFYRQKQDLTPTDLVRLTPLTVSYSSASTGTDWSCATLPTVDIKLQMSDRSVCSHLSPTLYLQKQNPLTDLVCPTTLTASSRTLLVATDSSCATYVLTVQTDQVMSDRSMCSHLSTTFYRRKTDPTLTDFILPTTLNFSRSAVREAANGPSATSLRTLVIQQIKPEK